MNRVNKYYRRSKISEYKFRRLARCFALDFTATETAALTGLTRRSVNAIFLRIRRRLAEDCELVAKLEGIVEIDESYFGPKRIPGKRGRGAGGKTIVFGIHKRGENIYTQIVPDARKKTLQDIIRGKISLDSIIHSDAWRGYDGLVDFGYKKHFRIRHNENEFADGERHINGIESFWSFAKRRLYQFNGISRRTFYLHLKECEWRFNHRNVDLYQALLKLLRQKPL